MAASNTRFTQNSLGQSKTPIDSDHGIYRYSAVRQEPAGAVKRGRASLGRNLAGIVPLQCSCTFARRPTGWQ